MHPRSYPSPPGWAWQTAGKASKGGGLLSPGSCACSPLGSPRGANRFFPALPQFPTQAPRYTWKAADSPGLPKSHTHHQRRGRGLMSTFLKALRMTKDIPEVLSRRKTLPRLLLRLPHLKVMATSQGTPGTTPGLAVGGWAGAAAPGALRP